MILKWINSWISKELIPAIIHFDEFVIIEISGLELNLNVKQLIAAKKESIKRALCIELGCLLFKHSSLTLFHSAELSGIPTDLKPTK